MHHLRPVPIAARHALRQAASSGDWAGSESALANRRAVKTASTKTAGVKTASTKAVISVETAAMKAVEATVEAAMKALEAAVEAAMETAEAGMAAAARRHKVRCKNSKCCSRQHRDYDFTEHD